MRISNLVDSRANLPVNPFSPEKLRARRTLKIEDLGDRWSGKVFSGIRLKGRWLFRAGFRPGHRVAVIVDSPGVIQLRALTQLGGTDQAVLSPEQRHLEFANANMNMRLGE